MLSKSTLEYLKVIYLLSKRNNKIRVTDIAKELNCSKPSVTKQLNILKEHGTIEYEIYSNIKLTDKGTMLAKKIIEENDIIYLFLSKIINVNKELAMEEAKKLKGIMNDETINMLAKYVYKTLGFRDSECDFDITKDKCRNCFNKLKEEDILYEEFIEN